jgi:hypothetical protein
VNAWRINAGRSEGESRRVFGGSPHRYCANGRESGRWYWVAGGPSPGLSEARVSGPGALPRHILAQGARSPRRELSAGDDLSFLR